MPTTQLDDFQEEVQSVEDAEVQTMEETATDEMEEAEEGEEYAEAVANPRFQEEWEEAQKFWLARHRIWDYSYLQYRSILTYNNVYGERYLRTFGLQVFVPRTFMVVEAIKSQLFARNVSFSVESFGLLNKNKAKYFEQLDNAEWKRSKASEAQISAQTDSLLFGNGYVLNEFVEDIREVHIPVTAPMKEAKPQDPDDGEPNTDAPAMPSPRKKLRWKKTKITKYKGMRPKALNPYYVFPTVDSTGSGEEFKGCFVYNIMDVDAARAHAVAQGWMTEEEAKVEIYPIAPTFFDHVRDIIDSLYSMPLYNGYNRGDHVDPQAISVNPQRSEYRSTDNLTFFIEQYKPEHYEVRLGETGKTLYVDFNVYPHKEIPIVPFFNHKVPHEFPAMGEPEIIRYQQVEENKVHNFTLSTLLMLLVQRFAIHGDAVEDQMDLSFQDPFIPIRLKSLPGMSVTQAIMPLPQPDVKDTPFKLMNMIKDTLQSVTGASDFIVSANDSRSDTATESNNLMAATTGRIRERIREMSVSIDAMVNQWHSCYPAFYDEAMDLYLTGEKQYIRYLPYDRAEANENPILLQEIAEEYNAVGKTVEEAFKAAGYQDVIFASDLLGNCVASVSISDPDMNENQVIGKFNAIIKMMTDANTMLQSVPGEMRRFNPFKVIEDALRTFPMMKKVDDYIVGQKSDTIPTPQLPSEQAQAEQLPAPVATEEMAAMPPANAAATVDAPIQV